MPKYRWYLAGRHYQGNLDVMSAPLVNTIKLAVGHPGLLKSSFGNEFLATSTLTNLCQFTKETTNTRTTARTYPTGPKGLKRFRKKRFKF